MKLKLFSSIRPHPRRDTTGTTTTDGHLLGVISEHRLTSISCPTHLMQFKYSMLRFRKTNVRAKKAGTRTYQFEYGDACVRTLSIGARRFAATSPGTVFQRGSRRE